MDYPTTAVLKGHGDQPACLGLHRQSVAKARIKPESSKSCASALTTGLSSLPLMSVFTFQGQSRESGSAALFSSCSTSKKWELQHSQVELKTEHLEQKCQVGKLFWQLMKMCYSQRPPFPKLQAASSSWSVWITSSFPLCSISGRVMEMWTFGQAELIYLQLLCFSPVPASPQNICFVFYSSFNWEQCWMLSNCLFLWVPQSNSKTIFYF